MPHSLANVVLHIVSRERFSHGLNTNSHVYGRRLLRFIPCKSVSIRGSFSPASLMLSGPCSATTRGISPRWGLTVLSGSQPRADAPWAIESRPVGAESSTSSLRTSFFGI